MKKLFVFFAALVFLESFSVMVAAEDNPLNNKENKICAEVVLKDDNAFLNILTASTALIAVIVGPLVSLYIMKRQTYAPLNYDLANKARESIVNFLAVVDQIQSADEKKLVTEKEKQDMLRLLYVYCNSAKLILSGFDDCTSKIIESMDVIVSKISCKYSEYDSDISLIDAHKNEIRKHSLEAIKCIVNYKG